MADFTPQRLTAEDLQSVMMEPALESPLFGLEDLIPSKLPTRLLPFMAGSIGLGTGATKVGKKVLKSIAKMPDLLKAVKQAPQALTVVTGKTSYPGVIAEMLSRSGRMTISPETLRGKLTHPSLPGGVSILPKLARPFGTPETIRHEALHMLTENRLSNVNYLKEPEIVEKLIDKIKGFLPKTDIENITSPDLEDFGKISEGLSRSLEAFDRAVTKTARGVELTPQDFKAVKFYKEVIQPAIIVGIKSIPEALGVK